MASLVDQLRVMLWRNYLLKKRGWKTTLQELLLPLMLIIVVVLVNMAVGTDRLPAIDTFPAHNLSRPEFALRETNLLIAGPYLQEIGVVMDSVTRMLNASGRGHQYKLFQNVTSRETDELYGAEPNFAEAAVQFLVRNDSAGSGRNVVYGYELRLPWDTVVHVNQGCSYKDGMGQCNEASGLSTGCPGNQALTSGLLSLQYVVETALIQTLANPMFKPPTMQVQMMPVHTVRPGTTRLQYLVSITMVIALAPLAYCLARTVTTERESRHRMLLRIMGLQDTAFWLSWLLVSLAPVVAVSAVACVIVLLGGMFHHVGLLLFFLLMLLYGASLVTLGFLMAVFFTKAKIAGGMSSVVTVLSSLLYLSVSLTRSTSVIPPGTPLTGSSVHFGGQLVLSLFSPVAFALGLDHAIFLDEEGQTGSTARVTSGQFPLLASLLMLLLDAALYGLLAAYLDNVVPSKDKISRKAWYCFTPSYWRSGKVPADGVDNEAVPFDTPQGPHIEPLPEGFENKASVRIRDLTKQFSQGKAGTVCAVNGLDLDICEGQITCVLGHSGSGKSTLVSMLTGIMAPSSGSAFVYNTNVSGAAGPNQISGKIGYCPQHDVYMEDLTVQEHLQFCARLKGVARVDLENEITKVLQDMGLTKKRHHRPRELSGVQRRKLSLAMALLGNSKLLVLDEPSSGLDSESRRQVWGVLQDRKQDRVILVTTHHMDEADILADRKAVLSKGRLRCVGSSAFVKKQFGVGYHLNVVLGPNGNTERVLRAVKSVMRGANLESVDDDERLFAIPQQHTWKLSSLFKKLESSERGAEYLGIKGYSIFCSSLEQVFLQLAEEEEAGNVFISPLLTPGPDNVFDEEQEGDTRHHSDVHLPRPGTSSALEELARRLSMQQGPQSKRKGSNSSSESHRRKSAFPRLQSRGVPYRRSNSDGGDVSMRDSNIGRRISSIFTRNSNRDSRPSSMSSVHFDIGYDDSYENSASASKRNSQISESIFKKKKSRARSFQAGAIQRSKTEVSFDTLSKIHEYEDPAGERPRFTGSVMPTSLAARRATVAAFKDFRRSISVHADMSAIGDLTSSSLSSNPLTKILMLDSFQQRESFGSENSSVSGFPSTGSALPSVQSGMADMESTQNGKRDKRITMPATDIRKVFSDLKPMKEGLGLECYRFKALLKARFVIKGRRKWALLLRMLLPVVLTLLAIGLFYASMSSMDSSEETSSKIRLDNINSLLYRNSSGRSVDRLLDGFGQMLGDRSRVTDYGPAPITDINSTSGLESVLNILSENGSEYNMIYNYTCGTALTQLTSLVFQAARAPLFNTSSSKLDLALQTEAWLHPWPDVDQSEATVVHNWVPILLLGLALAVTPALFAATLVDERKRRIASLLNVSGASRLVYWMSAFVSDAIEFSVGAALLAVLGAVSQMEIFEEEGAILVLFLLVILYVPVSVLWVYVASFAFNRPKTCRFVLPAFVVVISVSAFCAVHFLDKGITAIGAKTIHIVATICCPPYIPFGVMHYISRVKTVYGVDHFSKQMDIPTSVFFQFGYNIAICLVLLFVYLLVLLPVLLLLDTCCSGQQHTPFFGCNNDDYKHLNNSQPCDDTVRAERERVKNICSGNETWPQLVVNGLSKLFRRQDARVVAVTDACFTVCGGEVLGLLGPSGSGKTTAVDMVVGLCQASRGTVSIESQTVTPGDKAIHSKVGYCPQRNSLWTCLTMDEHMDLYGAVRGLSPSDIDIVRESLYRDLDLNMHRDEKTMSLSEGKKRKLGFAVSVLGQQSVVLLDEPSAGMDPRAKRVFWNAIGPTLKANNRCAIVTTHSVEEAEALCSRVAVMVNGEIKCLGSPEELRTRFQRTYILEMRLREAESASLERQMDMLQMLLKELFPNIAVLEHFRNRVVFKIKATEPGFSLASTFETLDSLKRNLNLEDYTFSHATMEQVYLDFARHQSEGESRYCVVSKKGDTEAAERTEPSPNSLHRRPEPRDSNLNRTSGADLKVVTPENKRHSHAGDAASAEGHSAGADAAVGVVIYHNVVVENVDVGGAGGSGGGGADDGSAAAPLTFSVLLTDGVDNPACTDESEENIMVQTSL